MVAIGGWGDTGFSEAAKTETNRRVFANNVGNMVQETGADGVDIDWEYPGGNGEDYKEFPNDERVWEIEAYPKLLAEIRSALGPGKLMSAAVPGLERDMIAFTKDTLPRIMESLDFLNVMTYDLMNRRDNVTKHHTGVESSLTAVDLYLDGGVSPAKVNLGLAFYAKWFMTDPRGGCHKNPVGCKTVLMEDPSTGADLGGSGGFSWHDGVPSVVSASFQKALAGGLYDSEGGGNFFWDSQEDRWWTWDTPDAISTKFPAIVEPKGLGGVFAWGLGEDAPNWKHLNALTACYRKSFSDGHVTLRKQGARSPITSPASAVRDKTEL